MDVIHTLLQQIEQARAHADRPLEAESLYTLGNVYFDAQRWDDALQAYQQSVELFRALGNALRLAGAQVRLADIHMARQEWEQALALCRDARDTMEQAGDKAGLARAYMNLGILYWQTGEWKEALNCYHRRLEIVERLGDAYEIANVSANLGMLYQVFRHRDNAAFYLARGYVLACRNGFDGLKERAGAQLANVFGAREAADAYLREFTGDGSVTLPPEADEGSEALSQLLDTVTEALEGDTELAQQLAQYTVELAGDDTQPAETRELSRILAAVLDGERAPDMSALPAHIAGPLAEWLGSLPAGDEPRVIPGGA